MDVISPEILRVLVSATGILLVSVLTAFWKNRRLVNSARGSSYAGGFGSGGRIKPGAIRRAAHR